MAQDEKKNKISRIVFLTSITFRKTEFNYLIAERDMLQIEFDRGIFCLTCLKTGEQVFIPIGNVKFWTC